MGLSQGFLLSWMKHINYNFAPSDILHPKAQQVKYELCLTSIIVSLILSTQFYLFYRLMFTL